MRQRREEGYRPAQPCIPANVALSRRLVQHRRRFQNNYLFSLTQSARNALGRLATRFQGEMSSGGAHAPRIFATRANVLSVLGAFSSLRFGLSLDWRLFFSA